jgi:hypothetical protein
MVGIAIPTMVHGPTEPHGTRVRTKYVRTRVRTRVLLMLCHNFLIGNGHTCALRTTCVLEGYTAPS